MQCYQTPNRLLSDSISTAPRFQKHCTRHAKALLQRLQNIALVVTEHCSGGHRALLYIVGSIALEGTEQCSIKTITKRCLHKNAGTFYNNLRCDYSAIQMVTRLRSFSANGCTRAPLLSFVIRSAGMLYFSVRSL